jgi:signal-transduction protein with cAMP-binding, CBS, and nucleotidyltransferase domain
MSNKQPRIFRRGETILKAGFAVNEVYLIQSGLASIQVSRGGKMLEIAQAGSGQLLGEEALWGAKLWSVTVIANNDVRATPMDLKQAFGQLASAAPYFKVLMKGLVEKQRANWSSLVELKASDASEPCPPSCVTQLFAVIHQSASYTGTKKPNGETSVTWPAFKKYCQRTFLESPVRLEQAINILVKL